MQAIPQLLWLKCLKSIVDFSPLTVEPETLLLDAIALMAKQGKSTLVGLAGDIVGCLTEKDVVRLVASGIDFTTTRIAEVMQTITMTPKLSELGDLATVLFLLRQSDSGLLPVADEYGLAIGAIVWDSIYQLLEPQVKESAAINLQNRESIHTEWSLSWCSENRLQHSQETEAGIVAQAVTEQTDTREIIADRGTATDISQQQAALRDRQQALAALRDSEERFRNLIETSSDLIWEVDKNGIYTYVSPKIRDILGYEPEEVLGKSPVAFMPLDRRERIAQEFAVIFITPQPFQCLENIQMHRNGELVWLETSGVPVFDSEGKFQGYRGMSRDITQRQQAETSLRNTQQQLQAIIDNSPAVIYLVDAENKYLLVNKKFEQLFNLKQEQILKKSIYDIWNQDIAEQFVVHNQQVITNGIPVETEEIVPHADGLHTYLSIKFPLKDANGVVYAICGISTDITERKLVEESLLGFRKAIESTSDAVCMGNILGETIYVNPAFVKLYDYTLEELRAAGGGHVIFKYPAEFEQIVSSIQSGQSWRGEVSMQARNGRISQVYLCADALKDATGKVLGTVCIHTDVTQRKLAEESLRLRDRAIAACSNGIMIADASIPNGPIIYVNSAYERMSGYWASEVIGQSFCLFLNNGINQLELQQLNAAMQAGKDCSVILRNYRKDGRISWNELNISPVYDVAGVLTHYIGIQTDISDRKQAETALLVSQQRLQYLLSSTPAVIYTCKLSGDFGATFVSENVKAMMGYEAKEFVEDSSFWSRNIHPDDLSEIFIELAQALDRGHYSLNYRFLHQDGNYRWVCDKGKLMKDETGKLVEFVGYWADITEQKQLEQELIHALEKEKELNELKSRFISMTSHEFRTPLSTILSSAELLEHYRHKWTQEKQLIHLRRIQSAVSRMTDMLNEVLFIGKADAGILDYQPTSFDLVEYCCQLIEDFELDLNNQRRISFNTHPEVIPCFMDEKLLGHILNNLLSNAIKYSPSDSNVALTLTCQDGQAIFEIQDQGIGIPPEDISHLFKSFHRASNVGNILGTGLGLSIVKKCIDIHQGDISVSSTLGVGSKFTVTLPLKNQMQSGGNYDKNFSN
ncbi:PAS domain S-box protein [Calothrix sp. NIES-2098]|uniref:PAS domain S-box protein n=1 Tax=Calothrix sp. NIES-2098 TaxID=1954171 RepID=UPI000B5DF0AD|nr:two-component sensor histidine kinase [Calothrix sp. NIES-2098]